MCRSFSEYKARKQAEYGAKFDPSGLASQFIPLFESGERIKVWISYGGDKGRVAFGTVGVTTGWRPAFLLMHNVRSHGSSTLLSVEDTILAVKVGRNYRLYSDDEEI